jgi:tetrahydromethanopterin S-methyltransferase subunit G
VEDTERKVLLLEQSLKALHKRFDKLENKLDEEQERFNDLKTRVTNVMYAGGGIVSFILLFDKLQLISIGA